jgi:hypothetical protein
MATSRPFAYNPSQTAVPGAIQVGDLSVVTDINSWERGNLQWWMGPEEDSGYVVAAPVPSQDYPTPVGNSGSVMFWRSGSKTSEELILVANIALGSSYSTVSAALSALSSAGYWSSYAEIVTADLTMRLDASNSSSYPGSGSTWFDLAGTQDNISLVNSPAYTSGSPSYFSFNGSTQRGSGTALNVIPATSYTKSLWFYLNAYVDNNLVSSDTGGHFMFFAGGNKLYSGHANWGSYTLYPSVTSFSLNTWYYAALTFNTTDGFNLYVNGSFDSSYTADKSARGGNGSTNLASFGAGNLLNGRIAKVYTYSRSLSSAEVLQNFNADKAEFGL